MSQSATWAGELLVPVDRFYDVFCKVHIVGRAVICEPWEIPS
jgi:hypothetical protein